MKTIAVCAPTYRALPRLRDAFLPSYALYMDGRSRSFRYVLALYAQGYRQGEVEGAVQRAMQPAIVEHAQAQTGAVSMTLVRYESHLMVPGADFILWVDDDFEFRQGSVEWYDNAAEYMADHPQCGVVQLLGGASQVIAPKVAGGFWTACGLMFRPRRRPDCKLVIPHDAVGLAGVHDDQIACWSAYAFGMYAACVGGCPTLHRHEWRFDGERVTFERPHGAGQGIHAVGERGSPYVNDAETRAYLSRLLGVDYREIAKDVQPSKQFWREYADQANIAYGTVDPCAWRAVAPCM
jgi:hypothetical protein